MSEKIMRTKKGKNFKKIIEEEKNKGKNVRKLMRALTNINTSLVYGGSFLLFFVALDVVIYQLLAPSVLLWAGILVGTALVSSLLASRITNILKKNQWKHNNV
jgi:hypothetical protein